ncbi:MAG: FecR family protein [Terracidiphilus sp.]
MKIKELNRRGLAAFALSAALLTSAAWADDVPQPAARAIRLSNVEGQVQLSQDSQLLANPAVVNTPLFEGTVLTTGDDGRAEIQFEDGSVARLSPNSSMALAVLRGQDGSSEAEIAIESGLGYFELQGGGLAGTIRVRFAGSVVTASGFTVLRVNLDNAPGEVAVFSGNAHLEHGSAMALDLHGGESVALNGADPSRYNLSESIEPDSWDTWNSDRDEALTADAAARTGATKSFPDAGNPAWGDLDANGTWYNVPDQGYIWSPSDASDPGFDPYGNGNWMSTPGYGYIFVSGYSWGYMPFHCGTWNYFDSFGWGWAPGINGCHPWWGGGHWASNLGILPPGYHGISRPPRHTPFRPPHMGGERAFVPMIPVNRHGVGSSNPLPSRDRTNVVSIAGYTVQALHPLSPRPHYDHSAPGFVNHPVGSVGTTVHGFSAGTGSNRPVNTYNAPRPVSPAPSRAPTFASPSPSRAPGPSVVSHAPSGGGGGGGHAAAPSGGSGHK